MKKISNLKKFFTVLVIIFVIGCVFFEVSINNIYALTLAAEEDNSVIVGLRRIL